MANHNGRSTHRDDSNIEHGYQDPRDQRDRANGRDDFRGLDRDRFADKLRAASGMGEGGRDQWAERDRSLYSDRDEGTYRGAGGSMERPSGYGHDDGNPSRDTYRGQSGAQSGGNYGNQNANGGNRGQWGDFDQGGRSGGGENRSFDSMSPRDRKGGEGSYHGGSAYGQVRGQHAGKGPQGFQRSDERIKEMVHEALTDHEHLDATHIVVDVKEGEVSLSGSVEDRATKRLAEDVVMSVKGVRDVHNQIRIGTAAAPMTDMKSRPS